MINQFTKSRNTDLYHLEFIIEDFKFVEFIIKSKELNKNLAFFKIKRIDLPWGIRQRTQRGGNEGRKCCWSREREGTWRSGWTANPRLRAGSQAQSARSTEIPIHSEPKEHNNFYFKNFSGNRSPHLRAKTWNLNSKNKIFFQILMSKYWSRNFSKIRFLIHVKIKVNKKK